LISALVVVASEGAGGAVKDSDVPPWCSHDASSKHDASKVGAAEVLGANIIYLVGGDTAHLSVTNLISLCNGDATVG
jgi:hypothetical protein